jgi:predicted O-methyltransferase YrrM
VPAELFEEILGADYADALGAISADQARALHRVVRTERPELVLEVGMATGMSTLAILTALEVAGSGGLISVDPHQSTQWEGQGTANVARHGLSSRHTLVEEPDYTALPRLLAGSTTLGLAYVDGWHTFDHVVLDIFYIDRMLTVGGVIGFNDCGFAAVHRALRFLLSHRAYREIDVGLRPDYVSATLPKQLVRRALRWSRNDRYFRKTGDWLPAWNYYRRF